MEEPELKLFEEIVNEIYSFYSKSAKKMSTFRTTADALDVAFYRLNKIFKGM